MALLDNQIPKLANTPNGGFATLTSGVLGTFGTDTNGQELYTAGTNGGRVFSLLASSNSTAVGFFFLYILRGATVIPLSTINQAINAGAITGTKNTDALNNIQILGLPFDNTGRPYIPLLGGDILKCSAGAITNNTFRIMAMGADY